ncbi:helix-turn-helix domain-containing protein [Paenibacillus filicis]|uniref:Helix-turn-helix domain-containing protein n=1 Tax=Paenibacillus filicis TaxID=669464 RepID=A0ABU9DN25_9BACL
MAKYTTLIELGMNEGINEEFEAIPDKTTLSPSNVAKMLNVSLETVRRWCRQDKIPSYSWGGKYVIKGSDFKEFMRRGRNHSKLS